MKTLDPTSRKRLALALERWTHAKQVQAVVNFSQSLPGSLLLLGFALTVLMYGFSISAE